MAKLRLLGAVGIVAVVGGIASARAAQKQAVPLGELLRLAGALLGKSPSGTVVVAFDEHKVNTLIRTNANTDLPSHGRFWVDPVSGRVVASELVSDDTSSRGVNLRGVIDVRYGYEATVDLCVPMEMDERYMLGSTVVTGHATYGHFRKFRASGKLVPDPRGA